MENIKYVFLIFLLFCSFFSSVELVNAVAVSAPSGMIINFEPNLKIKGDCSEGTGIGCFRVRRGSIGNLEPYAWGDAGVAQYVTFNQHILSFSDENEWKEITFDISFPDEIEPGEHILAIGVREVIPKVSGVGANVGVEKRIPVRVPYPDEYIKASLQAEVIPANVVVFTLTLESLGLKDVSNIASLLKIYNSSTNVEVKDASFETISSLKSGAKKDIITNISESEFEAGDYSAEAFVSYVGKEATVETTFTIEQKIRGVPVSKIRNILPLFLILIGVVIFILFLLYHERKKKKKDKEKES